MVSWHAMQILILWGPGSAYRIGHSGAWDTRSSQHSGVVDPMLQKMAACGTGPDDPHMCRNLHRMIETSSRSLPVPISTAVVPIRTSKKGRPLKVKEVAYPLLRPSDWARCIFKRGGHFFLGGSSLDSVQSFGNTLEEFWRRYHTVDSTLKFEGSPRFAIPYALHGDEGRGKGKKPILVLSFQPLITNADMSISNLGGCPA